MKVVPINYPDDLEKLTMESNGECHVGIEKMSITYIQPDDMDSEKVQTITLETECQCSVGLSEQLRDDFYVKIKTGRSADDSYDSGCWAVSDGNELKELVDDFFKRLYGSDRQNLSK